MSVVNAASGQTISASARFTDEFGNPILNIAPPVTFKVFDPSFRLVLTGTGVQDNVDRALFTATFTLPASAPPTGPGERYRIQWLARTTSGRGGEMFTETEQFPLTNPENDPDSLFPKDVVVIPGLPFQDQFKINFTATPPNVSYSIIDEFGQVQGGIPAIAPPAQVGNFLVYTAAYATSLPVPVGVQQHYMGNWVAQAAGMSPQVESHPVYVMTPILQTICHAIYRMLSGGILENVGPYLTWTAGEISHHAIKGFEWLNGVPPRTSPFSISHGLPVGLTQYIEKAAMVSALRAQQFAYASDWDFQGLGVQLNVNRAALGDLINQFESDLGNAQTAKTNWYASGSPIGAVHAAQGPRPLSQSQIVIGPGTNFVAPNVGFEARVSSALIMGNRGITGGNRRL
jgi:hypothetical protein